MVYAARKQDPDHNVNMDECCGVSLVGNQAASQPAGVVASPPPNKPVTTPSTIVPAISFSPGDMINVGTVQYITAVDNMQVDAWVLAPVTPGAIPVTVSAGQMANIQGDRYACGKKAGGQIVLSQV